MSNTSDSYKARQKRRVLFGFIWVVISAALWGASYVGYAMQDIVSGFINWPFEDNLIGTIAGVGVVSAITSLMFAIVTFFIWCVPAGKGKEVIKTLVRPKMDKWLAFGTIFGGILATFGTILATKELGATLAASASVMSIALGAIMASVWNKEKLARNTIIGIIAIIVGGIIMLDPESLINDLSAGGAVSGYLGLIACIVGWGVEGNITVRVYDITDSDSSLATKQIWDSLIWFVILLPILGCCVGFGTLYGYLVDVITNSDMLLWLFIIALVMVPCNACTNKGFPLIGVARTASLNALYAPFSMIFLFLFMGIVPAWVVLIGVVIALVGVYVMYYDSGDLAEGNRASGGE